MDDQSKEPGKCELLGSFALLVQGALGGLALLSLVWKRYRERPQRPLRIWFFDASKQVFGSVLVHMANIFMAMLSGGAFTPAEHSASSKPSDNEESSSGYHPNPCSFYLLNLLIDTTVGILILVWLLKIFTALCHLLPDDYAFSHGITSGDYGHPPKTRNWLKQSLIYFAGLMGMKVCVWIMFEVAPWLGRVGDWALKWTEGNKKVQIAFVMFIFPLVMNGMQYYIIDTYIKHHDKSPHLDDDDEDDDISDISSEDDGPPDTNMPQIQPSSAIADAAASGGYSSDEEDHATNSRLLGKRTQSTNKRPPTSPSVKPVKER